MSLLRAIGLKGRLLLTQAARGAAPFEARGGAAEQALRQSERRLRMIADNLPVLIAYVDQAQYYRFCNHNYERLFGQGRGGLVGKRVGDVLDPTSYAISADKISAALRGVQVSFERELTDGESMRHWRVDYMPDFAVDGGALYASKSASRRTCRMMF